MAARASPARATAATPSLAAAVRRLRSTPAIHLALAARRLARLAKPPSLLSAPPSLPRLDLSSPDEEKEAARRELAQEEPFTHERWAKHRSSRRYARHMAGGLQSRVLKGLAQPLAGAAAAATLVCTYESALQAGALPEGLPSLLLPAIPFDLTGGLLSLLLVFRTTASYDRWLAAVAAWTTVNARSRDALRQLLACPVAAPGGPPAARAAWLGAGGEGAPQVAAAAAAWLGAFSRALKAELTPGSNLQLELRGKMGPAELELLTSAQHPPSLALLVLSRLAGGAPLTESQRARLDESLTLLQDTAGRCEQLLRTPIPLSYTRHTSRCLLLWLLCLPLGLWPSCGWGTVPLAVAVSAALLGIEEIGVAIEEPFSMLPLEQYCCQVEAGTADLLRQAAAAGAAADAATAGAGAAPPPAPAQLRNAVAAFPRSVRSRSGAPRGVRP